MAAEQCFVDLTDNCVVLSDVNGRLSGDIKRVPGADGDLQCIDGSGMRTTVRWRRDKRTSTRVVVPVDEGGVDASGTDPSSRTKGGQLGNHARLANPAGYPALARVVFEGVLDCRLSPSEAADARVEASIQWRYITHDVAQQDPWTGFEGSWSWVAQEVNKQRYGQSGSGGQQWYRSFRFTGIEEVTVPAGYWVYMDSRLRLEALDGFTRWDSYVLVNQATLFSARN